MKKRIALLLLLLLLPELAATGVQDFVTMSFRAGDNCLQRHGSARRISLPVFNPASPAPDQVQGFIESHGYIAIEAEHYYSQRIAVAFDDDPPKILTRSHKSSIENLMTIESTFTVSASGPHTLNIWMVDPGIVLDKIILNTGGLKPSYLGPPESCHRP